LVDVVCVSVVVLVPVPDASAPVVPAAGVAVDPAAGVVAAVEPMPVSPPAAASVVPVVAAGAAVVVEAVSVAGVVAVVDVDDVVAVVSSAFLPHAVTRSAAVAIIAAVFSLLVTSPMVALLWLVGRDGVCLRINSRTRCCA